MPFLHGHALVIGVGTYQYHPGLNVPVTVADAEAVARVLQAPETAGYPPSQVKLLHDAAATRQGVLDALAGLVKGTTSQDTICLFYAGHGGDGTDGVYTLSTTDSQLADNRFIAGTGISLPELLQAVAALPVKRTLLIFNACHSGAVTGALDVGPAMTVSKSLSPQDQDALLGSGEGRIVMSACRQNQLSHIGTGALTIFTEALVGALNGVDVTPRSGYIGAYDLYEAVYDAVHTTVPQQEPELTIRQGVGPFPVALFRGATSLGTFQASATPPAIPAARTVDVATAERRFRRLVASITMTQIDSGGGAVVTGTVNTGGGAFVGHDQHIGGDYVSGDKVGGDKVQGDKIDASGSQGFINRASGPINQNYGTQRTVTTGGGDYAEGNIDKRSGVHINGGNVHGPVVGSNSGTVTTSYGLSGGDVAGLFTAIQRTIDARREDPNVDKPELKTAVDLIQSEVTKGEAANTSKVERWLRNLGSIAPDIFDATVAALVNPVAGVAMAVKKVAQKVKIESAKG